MKKIIAVFLLAFMVGCAPTTTGLRIDDLRKPEYVRTEQNLFMTFPEIQMALFKHERVCGNAPVFKMLENETSHAIITEANVGEMPWNQVVMFDLIWLQPSMLQDTRTRVYAYSFFSNSEVKQRIARIFNAINKPEECDA